MSRSKVWTTALVGLFIVALVIVHITRDHRPPFEFGDETASSRDGEGLITGRQTPRKRIYLPNSTRAPLIVEVVGPGSAVFNFRTVSVYPDAGPIRLRQRTLSDLVHVPNAVRRSPVRWQGFVALQAKPGGNTTFRASVGPWQPAGRDGVVVKPGQQVRLRTRYDLGPARGTCRTTIVLDGPRWEVRKGNGSWKILRVRDDPDGSREERNTEVRTGQTGPLAFTSGRCRASGAQSLTIADDQARDSGDLTYSER